MQPAAPTGGRARDALKGTRRAWFAEAQAYVDTPVYDRYALAPGAEFSGPAIVEERESTAVIGAGGRCRVDAGLTLVIEP
jgi:N-methylhydantoinase A